MPCAYSYTLSKLCVRCACHVWGPMLVGRVGESLRYITLRYLKITSEFTHFLPDESTLCFLWHDAWDSERVVGDVGDLCGRTGALPVRMPC